MSDWKSTKEIKVVVCPECNTEIEIIHHSSDYVKSLEKAIVMCYTTLKQLIDSNKVSPAMYIDFGNGWKDTIGNIRADLPVKKKYLEEV